MEEEIRHHIGCVQGHETANVKTVIDHIMANEDVLATKSFDEWKANVWLEKLWNLWVTVRGFAYASGGIEQYKQLKKTTTQKN